MGHFEISQATNIPDFMCSFPCPFLQASMGHSSSKTTSTKALAEQKSLQDTGASLQPCASRQRGKQPSGRGLGLPAGSIEA